MRTYSDDPMILRDPTFDHVREVLEKMRQSESTIYRRTRTKSMELCNGLWRQQIIEWMYTLVKYCKLRHEAATGGAFFLDVAVARGVVKTPNDYQLGAMASLYLGLKVFDSPSMRVVKLSSLVKLGNAQFTEQDIVRMEREIINVMQWRLNPPTPNCFLQQYLVLLSTQSEVTKCKIEQKALDVIEVAVSMEQFSLIDPSIIGYAALLIALDQYLEEQKTSLSPCGMEMINLWQLRSFLYNMTNIAKLDHTSTVVNQTTSLLERKLKQERAGTKSHVPSPDHSKSSRKHSEYEFDSRTGRNAASSPTNVLLQ